MDLSFFSIEIFCLHGFKCPRSVRKRIETKHGNMKKRTGGVLEIIDEVEVTTTAGEVQAVDTENKVLWTLMKIHPLPVWVIVSDQLYMLAIVMLTVSTILLLKWVGVWNSNNSDIWHPSTTVARKLKKKEKQKKRKSYEPKLTEDGMLADCNQRWAIWNA